MAKKTKIFDSLLFEGSSLSLGRIAFWIIFGISIYFWLARPVADFPSTLFETLLITMSYNLVKRGMDTYKNVKLEEFLSRQSTLFNEDGTCKRGDISIDEK